MRRAVRVLRAGGAIAYPTEAVWGLGCDPENAHVVERILQLKQRDWRKGLILIASDFEQLRRYVAPLSDAQLAPALASWPGPHTWLVPANAEAPRLLTGGRPRIAVRVTAHPLAAALCRAFGGAIVSTSANVSGHPPARDAAQLRRQFGASVDLILRGELGGLEGPTPIRDLATGAVVRE